MKYKIKDLDNKPYILCLLIISIFIALASIGQGVALNFVLDSALDENNIPLILTLIVTYLIFISKPILEGIYTYFKSKLIQKNAEKLKVNLLSHIQKLNLIEANKYHSGELLTRLNQDSDNTASIFADGILEIFKGLFMVVIALCYTLYVSVEMTLVVIIFMPILVLWGKFSMPILQNLYKKKQEKESSLRIFLQEQLQNITFTKIFGLNKYNVTTFKKINKEKVKLVIKSDVMNHIAWGGGDSIGSLAFLTSVGIGCFYVSKGEMTVGEVMGFAQVINYIIWPFTSMMGIFANLQQKISSKKRVEEIFDIEEEKIEEIDYSSELHKNIIDSNVDKVLRFKDISFYYDKDNLVINNMSYDFSKNKLIGIVGESGKGKSTLTKLMLGLYSAQKGTISIECAGKSFIGKSIREYVSYVPQNISLSSGTIKENILKGNLGANLEDIIRVAKMAHIHDAIFEMPNKYETVLGESGLGVSLGQAQRIAIARALIREKPILILDEPTASLDPKGEKIIMDTIKEISKKCICIIITHSKLANEYCDEILKL